MTVAIIQARSSSKRFPNKVMTQINNKPLLNYVYKMDIPISNFSGKRIKCPREYKIYKMAIEYS